MERIIWNNNKFSNVQMTFLRVENIEKNKNLLDQRRQMIQFATKNDKHIIEANVIAWIKKKTHTHTKTLDASRYFFF